MNWNHMKQMKIKLGIVLSMLLFASQIQASPADTVVIIAGKLIDVKNATILSNHAILIVGEYINKIGPKDVILSQINENSKIINLESATVLPGLIDCHVHLGITYGNNYFRDLVTKTSIDNAIEATVNARKTLEAGFTSVRDLGTSKDFIDIGLRNAINSGIIPGPRIQSAGIYIGSTGGHADMIGISPYIIFDQFSGVADGNDEIRKMIRFNVKNGADLIKIMLDGTIVESEPVSDKSQYSQEEINVCAEEAKRWGKKVSAHVHGAGIIKKAINAGIYSIEHASYMDDECIRLAKQKGTFIIPTPYWIKYTIDQMIQRGAPTSIIEKYQSLFKLQESNFKKIVQSGVKIVYGTDATIFPHGWNAKQFPLMVEWGMNPMKALQSATIDASELLGWSDKVGVLESGYYADIIAVEENPVDNIGALEQVDFIMKGGRIVKNNFDQIPTVK